MAGAQGRRRPPPSDGATGRTLTQPPASLVQRKGSSLFLHSFFFFFFFLVFLFVVLSDCRFIDRYRPFFLLPNKLCPALVCLFGSFCFSKKPKKLLNRWISCFAGIIETIIMQPCFPSNFERFSRFFSLLLLPSFQSRQLFDFFSFSKRPGRSFGRCKTNGGIIYA